MKRKKKNHMHKKAPGIWFHFISYFIMDLIVSITHMIYLVGSSL